MSSASFLREFRSQALRALAVQDFLGDANRFPRLRSGVLVGSPLGKWRQQTRLWALTSCSLSFSALAQGLPYGRILRESMKSY